MDDLFGDLPPPSEKKSEPIVSGIYDDLPKEEASLKRNKESEENKPTKKPKLSESRGTDIIYALRSFIAERQGERDEMQDAATLIDNCTEDYQSCNCGFDLKHVSFHGVFDGHGGKKASHFAKENLHLFVRDNFPKEKTENFDRELKKRLVKSFKETDEEFLREASKETPQWRDGSTAACVLAVNNVLYAANVGDSKTLLVRKATDGKNTIINLSKDHSPTLYEERQRIQNAGGFVRDGRVQGVLEVSRALGDIRFKKYVIATPDIFKLTLTEHDRYLLVACDGLWKGFTVPEAIKFIDGYLEDDSKTDLNTRYEAACKEVANEAIRRGSSDNVTVVLLRIVADES